MKDINANYSGNDLMLRGIGGWLSVLAIGVVLSPVISIIQMGAYYIKIINENLLPQLFHENIGLFGVVIFEMFVNLFLISFSIVLCVLFFRQSKKFPIRMIIFLVTNILITAIVAVLLYRFDNSAVSYEVDLTRIVIYALIWGSYLIKSKRVKNTFVN